MDLQHLDNEATNAYQEMDEACMAYNIADTLISRLEAVLSDIRNEYAGKYHEAREKNYQALNLKAYEKLRNERK
jgi:hypothetical protein